MNLNMQAFNINTLLGGLDKVRDVMGAVSYTHLTLPTNSLV